MNKVNKSIFLYLLFFLPFQISAQLGTSCGVPMWYSSRPYYSGSYVFHVNKVYKTDTWINESENSPDNNSQWNLLGDCDANTVPLVTDCVNAKAWDSTVGNYNTNDKVTYNNGLYKVRYWIAGSVQPDQSEAYQFIGVCITPPTITTPFSEPTIKVMSSLSNIAITATIDDYGFSPLKGVAFFVKQEGASSYTSYTMANTSGNTYSYSWTPAAYGDYNIIIKAENSVNVSSEIYSSIKIAKSAPPNLNLISPKNNAHFIQLNFEPILIRFTATATDKNIQSITFFDLTASSSVNISVTSQANYEYSWTPTTHGINNLKIKATDALGTTKIIKFSYNIIDPSKETLSFSSLPNQIKGIEGNRKDFTFDKKITKVTSRRPDLCTISFSDKILTISNPKVGRTGLEIQTGSGEYFVGLRIDNKDGTVAGLPEYVSIGSVSEDITGDIEFWKDMDNTNLLKNKRMDYRYIYINGGSLNGWNTWQPDRAYKFTKNSLKLGLIPVFIFYNIPDGGESYTTDKEHVEDPSYMEAYFNNLDLFFTHVKQEIGDELFLIILEPDFLGYMQQNNEPVTMPTAVGLKSIGKNAGNLKTLVQRINKTIDDKRKKENFNLMFGWQYNLWAKAGVSGYMGIIRETDTGDFNNKLNKIKKTGADIAQYGKDIGTLSYNADFVSIDKYGLDAKGAPSGGSDPEGYTWFWNNDHWLNYLALVKEIHQTSNTHVILWQLPVGHINGSQYISEYSGDKFPEFNNTSTHYEDSTTNFFFGDKVDFSDNVKRFNYFSQNKHNDSRLKVDNANKMVTFGNHFEEVSQSGIKIVLMGAGVGISTDGVGSPPTDDYFWIQKVQDYYINNLTQSIVAIDQNGIVVVPEGFSLEQNYPNPFNPSTTFRFAVPKDGIVKFTVHDLLGRMVYSENKNLLTGSYAFTWNGQNEFNQQVVSGVYFLRMEADGFNRTRKMLMMK